MSPHHGSGRESVGRSSSPAQVARATGRPLSVAVVGAGPRGLGVLERIVALAGGFDGEIRVHLVDPYPPGPGRVWRTDQSPLLLMNTTIGEQTVFPDTSSAPRVTPVGTGPDMGTWYVEVHGGEPAEVDTVFPPRRLYGEYLTWAYEHLLAAAPAHLAVTHHAARATDLVDAGAEDGPQTLRLDDGTVLQVDALVLCLGHVPAALTDERRHWHDYAASGGLVHLPPDLPADTPVDDLEAGSPVLFRGFGLNWFDLQARLTTGRGGRFVPDERPGAPEWALRYEPSGREPVLYPSSRRGVPYRAKPIGRANPVHRRVLTHFRPANLPDPRDSAGRPVPLRFDEHLWPLVLADLHEAWTAAGGEGTPPLRHFLRPLEGVVLRSRGAGCVPWDHAGTSDGHPGQGASAAGDEAVDLHTWMVEWLRADTAAAVAGPEAHPEKALFAVLWEARLLLKELVATGRVDEESYATEVRGWFEDFVAGICDGPPPQRFAELAALAEAGIVRFVGPQVRITTTRAGEPAAFVAHTPALPDEDVRARALVEAATPANRVLQADDGFLSRLIEQGKVTAGATWVEGIEQHSSGLAVVGPAMHTRDLHGRVHPGRYVHSIQLSGDRLGLAIAANPGRDTPMFRDAQALVEDLLDLAG
ncbi:FAD/NAD(P)-binding protein [Brevibacterium litoralis]|uniref:FAD/NAD(P)-binding protein n=1 Tax=Brevibacterium litoralis TaxID=3138935 RepID=UPI0032EFF2D7